MLLADMIGSSKYVSIAVGFVLLMGAAGCGDQTSKLSAKTKKLPRSGKAYYVSLTGSDSNPGTREKPWASPGYGSRRLKPGDTLTILGGRYVLSRYDEDIVTPPSGRRGAWITIKGERENRPTLVGRDNLLSAIDISGKGYIKIDNLEITSDGGALFREGIEGSGGPIEHISLRNLYIHHVDEGAFNAGDVNDLSFIDCTFTYCGFGSIGGPPGEHGGWRHVFIKGCRLSYSGHYYQGGDGSNRPYDRPDGLGIEPSEGPIEIADTVAEHNYGDGLDSKAANTYVHNSIVANNSGDGVKLWRDGSRIENTLIYGTGDGVAGGSPWGAIVIDQVERKNSRFEIINVTVHDNSEREAYPVYVQYDRKSVPIILILRNCIFANAYGVVYIGDSVKLTCEHNLFYRPQGNDQIRANGRYYAKDQMDELGSGNLYGDPLFVSPAWGKEGDYHLRAGSPAIGAGTPDGAPHIDLEGRPRGKTIDIGAYARPFVLRKQ